MQSHVQLAYVHPELQGARGRHAQQLTETKTHMYMIRTYVRDRETGRAMLEAELLGQPEQPHTQTE